MHSESSTSKDTSDTVLAKTSQEKPVLHSERIQYLVRFRDRVDLGCAVGILRMAACTKAIRWRKAIDYAGRPERNKDVTACSRVEFNESPGAVTPPPRLYAYDVCNY